MGERTPGPWQIDCSGIEDTIRLLVLKADAILINAAPDLLEALIAHDKYMMESYESPDDTLLYRKAAENWRRCRAAIAKATGK